MPKRTNDFQQLVHRLETLLHPAGMSVVESAMVHNWKTGADEEVDVLVTFNQGGRTYRTAVHAQDRSRPAGPDWIRTIKAQREDCKLNYAVAVHSKGFTSTARKLAACENIGLLTIERATDAGILQMFQSPVKLVQIAYARTTRVSVITRLRPFRVGAASLDTVIVKSPNGKVTALSEILQIVKSAGEAAITEIPKTPQDLKIFEVTFRVICLPGTLVGKATTEYEELLSVEGDLSILSATKELTIHHPIGYQDVSFVNSSGVGAQLTTGMIDGQMSVAGSIRHTIHLENLKPIKIKEDLLVTIDGLTATRDEIQRQFGGGLSPPSGA